MKKFLYIALAILGAGAVIAAGYLLSNKNNPAGGAVSGPPGGGLPEVNLGSGGGTQPAPGAPQAGLPQLGLKFGPVSDLSAVDYYAASDGSITFIQDDGEIKMVGGGKTDSLSPAKIEDILYGSFSYDGKKIIAASGNPEAQDINLFDTENNGWRQVSVRGTSFVWSPSDYRIAYLAKEGSSYSAYSLDTKNKSSGPQKLFSLKMLDIYVLWPSPNTILVAQKPSALVAGTVLSYDIKKKTFAVLAADKFGAEVAWGNAAGEGLLFGGNVNGQGGSLGLIDLTGVAVHGLNFLTLPTKCGFHGESKNVGVSSGTKTLTQTSYFLDCAVPRDQDALRGTPLPDGYYQKSFFAADDILKISLADGTIYPVFDDQNKYIDAYDLKYAGGKIYFINRYDKKIYFVSP